MPERNTIKRAKRDLRRGTSKATAAGEFVREEIHHIREGKHGARSTKQAIAIGLSKARSAATKQALRREPRTAASKPALSRHAHTAAMHRTAKARSASAKQAARTRAREHV